MMTQGICSCIRKSRGKGKYKRFGILGLDRVAEQALVPADTLGGTQFFPLAHRDGLA